MQIVAIDDQVLFYIENVDIMRNFKYIVITMMCALCGVRGMAQDTLRTEVLPTFRAVSPFDFAYSPDSPDAQRGTCVFTRTLWTRKELLDAAQKITTMLIRVVARTPRISTRTSRHAIMH